MLNEPTTGNSRRRHGAPPTGYSRIPIRSVSKMKATTARPVNAPINNAKTRKTWPSRCRNSAMRSSSEFLHQFPLVDWASLISGEFLTKKHTSPGAFGEAGGERWGRDPESRRTRPFESSNRNYADSRRNIRITLNVWSAAELQEV